MKPESPATSKSATKAPRQYIEPRGLGTLAAGSYVNRSEGWLKRARRGKTEVAGPKFLKIGKTVTYLREDLDAWLNQFGPSMAVLPGKVGSRNQQKQADD